MSGEQQERTPVSMARAFSIAGMVMKAGLKVTLTATRIDPTANEVQLEVQGTPERWHSLLNPITKDQAQTAFWGAVMAAVRRQHPIGSLTHNELDAVANDFLQCLFPEEAPTDQMPAGGNPS